MLDSTLQFIVFAALAIFFTGLAWSRQTAVPFFLAGFMWFIFSLVNMTEPALTLSAPLSWLSFGIGLILLLRGVWIVVDVVMRKGG